jgi:hypothetical protein
LAAAKRRQPLSILRECLLLEKWLYRLGRRARLTTRATWTGFSNRGRKGVAIEAAFVSEFAVRYTRCDFADEVAFVSEFGIRHTRLNFAEQPLALARSYARIDERLFGCHEAFDKIDALFSRTGICLLGHLL